jgi:hypothetical protein
VRPEFGQVEPCRAHDLRLAHLHGHQRQDPVDADAVVTVGDQVPEAALEDEAERRQCPPLDLPSAVA